MQRNQTQEHRILKYYIDNLWKEKTFRILKDIGFVDILAKRVLGANANFDTFLTEIDNVAKDQEYLVDHLEKLLKQMSIKIRLTLLLHYYLDYYKMWIDCNAFILGTFYGFREHSTAYKAILKLKDEWVREIETIRPCVDCYELWTTHETNHDYMTSACSRPHLLVYARDAKRNDPRMWPAKVISVCNRGNKNGMKVTVDFFGDCSRAEYPFAEYFLYSNAQEVERKKANVKFANDARIKKQRQYKRSFVEVKKYIKNVEKKFGFVPAATKMALTDVDQHIVDTFPGSASKMTTIELNQRIMDMYPGAFVRRPSTKDIVERQGATTTEGTNNGVQELHAGQVTNHRSHKSLQRKVSRSPRSRASSTYDWDGINGCDEDEGYVDRNSVHRNPINIKTAVAANVSQCSAGANDDTESGTTGSEVTTKDEALTRSVMEAERRCEESGKRIATTTTEQSVRKKVALANRDAVIITIGDDDDDCEITSTSAPSLKKQTTFGLHFDMLLDEFADVKAKIWKNQEQQKKLEMEMVALQQQEDIIKMKLRNFKK